MNQKTYWWRFGLVGLAFITIYLLFPGTFIRPNASFDDSIIPLIPGFLKFFGSTVALGLFLDSVKKNWNYFVRGSLFALFLNLFYATTFFTAFIVFKAIIGVLFQINIDPSFLIKGSEDIIGYVPNFLGFITSCAVSMFLGGIIGWLIGRKKVAIYNKNDNFIIIILIVGPIIAFSILYYYSKDIVKSTIQVNKQVQQETQSREQEKMIWDENNIAISGKIILSINDFPDEIQVSPNASFGTSDKIRGVKISPDHKWLAISISGAAYDFGWIYEISTKKLIPVAFSDTVKVKEWNDNKEIVFSITTAKPDTYEKVIDVDNPPIYPGI